MDLRALAAFMLVANSAALASVEWKPGRSKATLTRRVGELEAKLDVCLFERDTRVLRLTDKGRQLYARTRDPLIQVAEAELALSPAGDHPRGVLRVNAPLLFA